MFANGSTQIDTPGVADAAARGAPVAGARSAKTRIGRAMFLTVCSPRSSSSAAILPATWSRTEPDIATPPGSASVCRRAATLTPSP